MSEVQVIRPGQEPKAGPADYFTGSVSVASPFKGTGDARLGGATVTFQPGAHTNWHTHPLGQLLIVAAGHGWVQVDGKAAKPIVMGDTVFISPDVKVDNIAAYGTIFLGFPIWGETAPPPIRSFLKAHDLRGKTLRPFITHGGYGVGSSPAVLASHATGAAIGEPFVMEEDQERRTLNQVRDWLGQINR